MNDDFLHVLHLDGRQQGIDIIIAALHTCMHMFTEHADAQAQELLSCSGSRNNGTQCLRVDGHLRLLQRPLLCLGFVLLRFACGFFRTRAGCLRLCFLALVAAAAHSVASTHANLTGFDSLIASTGLLKMHEMADGAEPCMCTTDRGWPKRA